MATVYKRTRTKPIPAGAEIVTQRGKRLAVWTDGKTGRKRKAPLNEDSDKILLEAGHYLIQYYDHNSARIEVNSKTPDKDAAEQLAARLETEAMLRKRGFIDTNQERYATERRRPLIEHLADFRAVLLANGNTEKHVNEKVAQVQELIRRCNAEEIKDLTASTVQQEVKSILDLGRSLRTCNSYLQCVKSFTRWMYRDKRTSDDPLVVLQLFNAETDPRHMRRELTEEELTYLLSFVEGHTLRTHNLAGPDRAIVYRIALGTGFRAKELRSLTPESFALNDQPPTVTVDAASSKHRRRDVQPIRQDLADLLRGWLEGRPSGKRLFCKLPRYTARMMRADLDAARAHWLNEDEDEARRKERERSDFLAYEDSSGRFCDFHAMRHTYISTIVASGASVKTAQELARHSSPQLTIGRYSHTRLHDLTGALEALHPVSKPLSLLEDVCAKATGTDGPCQQNASSCQQNASSTAASGGDRLASVGDNTSPEDSRHTTDNDHRNVLSFNASGKRKATAGEPWRAAEGKGFEPSTPCGAPVLQTGR